MFYYVIKIKVGKLVLIFVLIFSLFYFDLILIQGDKGDRGFMGAPGLPGQLGHQVIIEIDKNNLFKR